MSPAMTEYNGVRHRKQSARYTKNELQRLRNDGGYVQVFAGNVYIPTTKAPPGSANAWVRRSSAAPAPEVQII